MLAAMTTRERAMVGATQAGMDSIKVQHRAPGDGCQAIATTSAIRLTLTARALHSWRR